MKRIKIIILLLIFVLSLLLIACTSSGETQAESAAEVSSGRQIEEFDGEAEKSYEVVPSVSETKHSISFDSEIDMIIYQGQIELLSYVEMESVIPVFLMDACFNQYMLFESVDRATVDDLKKEVVEFEDQIETAKLYLSAMDNYVENLKSTDLSSLNTQSSDAILFVEYTTTFTEYYDVLAQSINDLESAQESLELYIMFKDKKDILNFMTLNTTTYKSCKSMHFNVFQLAQNIISTIKEKQ